MHTVVSPPLLNRGCRGNPNARRNSSFHLFFLYYARFSSPLFTTPGGLFSNIFLFAIDWLCFSSSMQLSKYHVTDSFLCFEKHAEKKKPNLRIDIELFYLYSKEQITFRVKFNFKWLKVRQMPNGGNMKCSSDSNSNYSSDWLKWRGNRWFKSNWD